MVYEIRNYHFEPTLLEQYKAWAKSEAIPHLSQRMDVVGFWVNTQDAPQVNGEPQDSLGSANVTWIIRWSDLARRNDVWDGLAEPTWQAIVSHVPGGRTSYRRIEVKFADALV